MQLETVVGEAGVETVNDRMSLFGIAEEVSGMRCAFYDRLQDGLVAFLVRPLQGLDQRGQPRSAADGHRHVAAAHEGLELGTAPVNSDRFRLIVRAAAGYHQGESFDGLGRQTDGHFDPNCGQRLFDARARADAERTDFSLAATNRPKRLKRS
jgi:hypothetical protein